MRFTQALTTVLLTPFLTLPASAQYSIDKVVFHNTAPYTDAELLATTGLEAGQFLTHDSLINAAHHLLDTGLFDDAKVTLAGQGKARTVVVTLKPTPAAKLLPISFENLVWFTPDELTQGLHAHLPLYRGVASDAGTFPDTVQAALQQLLTAKSITATLSHAVIEPTTQHPVPVLNFRVDNPQIHIATVHLSVTGPPGAATELATLTRPALNKATNAGFSEGLGGITLEDRLLAPARDAGYITAHLDNITRTVAPSAHGLAVTYTATLVSGDPYKVSTLTFEPTPLYTADDFARDAKLHPGDLASGAALAASEAAITKIYLLAGYMDIYILSNPVPDTTPHTIAYTLHPVVGEQYRLYTITPIGLSPTAQTFFDSTWQLKPGDPYSDLAVETFLRKNVAQPAFRPYSIGFRASADPQTHLVDLTINFVPSGSATTEATSLNP